ncbi:MAG TPA: Rieske 2Fe-2S domain-containing protein [Gemmatimonadaceae bacterium]|nr:Rieske 2Fe-2S domain-containing protein [Gemmatimonadaceae bacterium]
MRSFASIRGHPIHPALIPFPIAFLTGAFVAHAASALFGNVSLWVTGGYLTIAGVATGGLAAIPGLLDYLRTVPPRSSGKRRATKHLLLMAGMLALFALSLAFRNSTNPIGETVVLLLQGVGTLLLTIGGLLGGTLVSRNQISVDHRYAFAGKWSETHVRGAAGTIVGALHEELKVNQMKLLHVDGRRIVLARTDDGYVAFDDRCTHRGASLADGAMICGIVQCPWHGSQFDAKTGAVRAGPAGQPIATYKVDDNGREVLVRVAADVTPRANAPAESVPDPVIR